MGERDPLHRRATALLLGLDLLPVRLHLGGRLRPHPAEHVRVTADQLLARVLRDRREVTGRVFQAGNGIFAVAEGWHKGPTVDQIMDPVQAGKVYGKWPGLSSSQLYENRDLAITTDFRDVFSELLTKQLAVPSLKSVFPGYDASPGKWRGILG